VATLEPRVPGHQTRSAQGEGDPEIIEVAELALDVPRQVSARGRFWFTRFRPPAPRGRELDHPLFDLVSHAFDGFAVVVSLDIIHDDA
jgi:hypothetical protein